MQLRLEFQRNRVADDVSAVTAAVRPILQGVLYGLKREVAEYQGGYEVINLRMLARLYRPGDGDCGLCFEYAVHDAVKTQDPLVSERVFDALHTYCNLEGREPASILFGAEKTGALDLIDTAKNLLTPESVLRYGGRGRPVKLKRHIDSVAAAFRRREVREKLPGSINGLWKADLFTGFRDTDLWVGTTVKINPSRLEGAQGLRIGIVPAQQGRTDTIRRDEGKNLIVCPLPYDGAFMEIFYAGWEVVQSFLHADANLPPEVALPRSPDREVARRLVDRRDYPVVDVIEALGPLAQPELLETSPRDPLLISRRTEDVEVETGSVLAPIASAY